MRGRIKPRLTSCWTWAFPAMGEEILNDASGLEGVQGSRGLWVWNML